MLEGIAARLHKARTRLDISLDQAAEEIGCSYQAVLNWENGIHVPLAIYRPAIERFIRKHSKTAKAKA